MTEAEAREIVERYQELLAQAAAQLSYRLAGDEILRLVVNDDQRVRLEINSLETAEDDDGRPCGGFFSQSYRPVFGDVILASA
jgi:hypothetical protein